MSTIRYRCKVKFRISFEHEMEVDTDNPHGDAEEAARSALNADPFIKQVKAKAEFLGLESHILEENHE